MKTSTKIWLIVASALVLIGSVAFVAVMAANQWSFDIFGKRDYKHQIHDVWEPFSDIVIYSDDADITFKSFAVDPAGLLDDQPSNVQIYDDPKVEYEVSVKNGVLIVEAKNKRKWYDYISFFSSDTPSIELTIRGVQYDSLIIKEDTGDVIIPEGLSFNSITVSASTGDVCCYSSVSGRLGIQTSTGTIDISDIAASYMSLETSTGGINVSSVECDGLDVNVSTGKTTMSDVACRDFYSNGSTGDLRMTDVVALRSMRIERSTGDVELYRCDAVRIEIETDTGDVSGSLLSPKVFIVQSDTGRVEIPETYIGGQCKIITDTGDIRITLA
ncbi:MAG: DUF4097 family beta strand repeat protein [Dehalococcoidales bacterium]|nr:DUF4097 family beta strand repeat protein [Dehalococcoidales bacterium]